jgi:hypothetical protein
MNNNETDGEVVYYRADVKGLKPGQDTGRMTDPHDGTTCTYATTNPDAARAFAVRAFRLPRDQPRSVYRVLLDWPVHEDLDFSTKHSEMFVRSHWGTVLDVFEEDVTMTDDEANRVMSEYAEWGIDDPSPAYDDTGYACVPRWALDAIRKDLRQLGTYPHPKAISEFCKERYGIGK